MGIVSGGREERGRLRLRPKCWAAEELWGDDITHSVRTQLSCAASLTQVPPLGMILGPSSVCFQLPLMTLSIHLPKTIFIKF